MKRSSAVAGLALAASALLAGCTTTAARPPASALGSLTPTPSVTVTIPTPPPGTAPSQTVTVEPSAPAGSGTPATPPAAPPATPSSGPAGPACTTADVRVTDEGESGAAGTEVETFSVVNAGSGPCEMYQWPFISLYGPQKQGTTTVEATLSTSVGHIPGTFGSLGASGGVLGLAPGDGATFYLKWSQIPSQSNDTCLKVDGFDFRPPQDTSVDDNLMVPVTFTECSDSTQVSQVLPPG